MLWKICQTNIVRLNGTQAESQESVNPCDAPIQHLCRLFLHVDIESEWKKLLWKMPIFVSFESNASSFNALDTTMNWMFDFGWKWKSAKCRKTRANRKKHRIWVNVKENHSAERMTNYREKEWKKEPLNNMKWVTNRISYYSNWTNSCDSGNKQKKQMKENRWDAAGFKLQFGHNITAIFMIDLQLMCNCYHLSQSYNWVG